jgi:hypothetical protein
LQCPNCKSISPDAAIHCSCGYNFQSGTIDARTQGPPTPLRTVNGIGKQMLDYRPAGPGIFEATVWFTFLYIPLFPVSAWLIRPAGLAGPAMSSKYSVDFVERRNLSLPSILKVYAATLAIIGPFLFTGLLFASSNPAAPQYKSTGTWFVISVIWACTWAGILRIRRDKLYERAQSAASISK